MKRLLIVCALLAAPLFAQHPSLTIDTIMRGHAFAGYSPQDVRWSPDGQFVYFRWKEHTDPVDEKFHTWVVSREGKGLRKLSDDEEKNAPPRRGDWTRDRTMAVYEERGDIMLYDAASKTRRILIRTTGEESSPRFTQDERRVAFVRGDNLFVLDPKTGEETQRTNIVDADETGPNVALFDDADKKKSESQKWVADEAKKLSDVLARRDAKKKEEDAKRKAELAIAPLKLKKGESVSDLVLSPDEKCVIVFLDVDADDARETVVPSYVTTSGYTTDIRSREKAGDVQHATRVASVSTSDGKVTWVKTGLHKNALAARETAAQAATQSVTTTKTEATAEKTEATSESDEREVNFENLTWSDDGTAALLPVRSADQKDWWLFALDPATAAVRLLTHDHDDAWVNWDTHSGFVPRSRVVWFLSERTGWQHLYTVPFEGGETRALTSGAYEVTDVQFADDAKNFFLTTSKDSLFEHHLYRLPVAGGSLTRLTTTTGWHEAVVSPDGKAYADLYSTANTPWELYIGTTRITTSPAPEFSRYAWIDPPIVSFKARDGVEVPAHIYEPPDWKGGPAVVFVHGAGYLQNVQRAWSYYFREYMFHHLLMERGYLVLDIDYRASQGYGRDWRTAIYRHMGGKDLDDEVDAAKWLVEQHGVDAKRIGMYGGSYGGFMTLMAMFTAPDVFAAGAALRPVTDWAHYDHEYTSAILNTPQTDPEAYRRSSPIYFAEGLKGALLICHGMIDTNVHYQDTVRLEQRLIELRKENWEVASYPLEDHSFVEETSWADEYKRILKLFERTLK